MYAGDFRFWKTRPESSARPPACLDSPPSSAFRPLIPPFLFSLSPLSFYRLRVLLRLSAADCELWLSRITSEIAPSSSGGETSYGISLEGPSALRDVILLIFKLVCPTVCGAPRSSPLPRTNPVFCTGYLLNEIKVMRNTDVGNKTCNECGFEGHSSAVIKKIVSRLVYKFHGEGQFPFSRTVFAV